MTKPHEYYMSQALKLAREAANAGGHIFGHWIASPFIVCYSRDTGTLRKA